MERNIIEVLKCKKLTLDEIALRIECDINELINELFIMEIEGKVESSRGGKYTSTL